MRRYRCLAVLVALALLTTALVSSQAAVPRAPELDAGFRLLYQLDPEGARAKFAAWQSFHQEDPLGSAAEALVAEFPDNPLFAGELAKVPVVSR